MRKSLLPITIASAVIVALLLVALIGRHSRAPFTPAQLHPRLTGLQVIQPSDDVASNVVAAERRLGGGATPPLVKPVRQQQYVVGRVDVDAGRTGGDLSLIVVDNRTHTVVSKMFAAVRPSKSDGIGQGWDGVYYTALHRYPQLGAQQTLADAASAAHTGQAFVDPMAVGWIAGATTSVPFVAVLDNDALPVTNVHRDLTVGLIFTSTSDKLWWATVLR
jgi:hypothetical protein